MFQDLTTGFPEKLGREALAAHLPPELIADLYPVGSWRDHPPGQPIPDLTAPQPEIKDIPLDESQSKLRPSSGRCHRQTCCALHRLSLSFNAHATPASPAPTAGPSPARAPPPASRCSRTTMHLALSVPGTLVRGRPRSCRLPPRWPFHVAGVTFPGAPFVIVGHNDHVAWGFTNLGADVQDLYIEHTRGTPSGAEYQTSRRRLAPGPLPG